MVIVIAEENEQGCWEKDRIYAVPMSKVTTCTDNNANEELDHLKLGYEPFPCKVLHWEQCSHCIIPIHYNVDYGV